MIINDFSNPFYVFKIGIEGYEGEHECWNETARVEHIMVRIQQEMKQLSDHWYPFGCSKKPNKILTKLHGEQKQLDIFFIVSSYKNEYKKWLKTKKYPDIEKLKKPKKGWKHWRPYPFSGKRHELPDNLSLWQDEGKSYFAVTIKDLEIYLPDESPELDLDGTVRINMNGEKDLFNPGQGNLLLRKDPNSKGIYSPKNTRIIARAVLTPPYLIEILK